MSKKRFIYHGYLQIAELDAAAATESAMPVLRKTYLWDPLEPAATRILAMSLFDETGTWAENLYLYARPVEKHHGALRHPSGPPRLVRIRPVWEYCQDGRECRRGQSVPVFQRIR